MTNEPIPENKRNYRIAVSIFFFCQGICFASWASRIPDIKTALSLSESALGSILLALPAGQLLTMPFSGQLVTRYGSRNVLKVALLFYGFAMIWLGLAQNGIQLAAALFFFGIGGNMCNIAVNTQAVGVEKIYQKPVMSFFHGIWSSAGFVGALVGLVMIAIGLTPLVHFCIVAILVWTTGLVINKRLIPKDWHDGSATKKSLFVKPDKVLLFLGIIGFCSMSSEGAMFDWSGVYFKEVVKAPAALVTLGYVSFMIMMATGRFIGDHLVMRTGRKKLLQVSGFMISFGLLISVIFPFLITSTLGFMIVGLGVSSMVPTVYSIAGQSKNISPGHALTAVSSISFFGFLIGPPLIGYIAAASSLRLSYAVIAVFGFIITVLVRKLNQIV